MALEVTYRERLYRVYKEVKNRLDYHIAVQNMTRRKEQEHMINWVEKHVVQSIFRRAGQGDSCQVHCGPKAAGKEGPSTAGYVNESIPIETARNS